jgi:hypothetical protein
VRLIRGRREARRRRNPGRRACGVMQGRSRRGGGGVPDGGRGGEVAKMAPTHEGGRATERRRPRGRTRRRSGNDVPFFSLKFILFSSSKNSQHSCLLAMWN